MNQNLRIIGGLYRGKKLSFPVIDGLRPTPNRVRETLFNWLMHSIRDARCLDAFAGSGALGFEAFSRGASQVVFVEQMPTAYTSLKKTALSFNTPALTVIHQDACCYLQETRAQFDLIFLDPPFDKPELLGCMDTLAQSSVLVPGGLLYLETPTEILLAPEHWEQVKLKRAGQVVYGLYRKSAKK